MLAYLRESPFKPHRVKFTAAAETRQLARQVVTGEATSSETYSFPNSNSRNSSSRGGGGGSRSRNKSRDKRLPSSASSSFRASRSKSPSSSSFHFMGSRGVSGGVGGGREGINTATTSNPNATLSDGSDYEGTSDDGGDGGGGGYRSRSPPSRQQSRRQHGRDVSSPTTHNTAAGSVKNYNGDDDDEDGDGDNINNRGSDYEGRLSKGRKIENGQASMFDSEDRVVVQYTRGGAGGGANGGRGGGSIMNRGGGKGLRPTPEEIQRRIKKFSKARRQGGGRRTQTYVLTAHPILSDDEKEANLVVIASSQQEEA
jgi:hypothetical protein